MSLAGCVSTPRIPIDAAPRNPVTDAPRTAPEVSGDPRTLMIDTALGMLGQPYKYGGAAPGGFDCSGLVVYAAAGAGIHLPRTASEQRQIGASVSRNHLQPGDLVFMHLARKELHVGIALGGARFIHAPSAGGRVRIDSIAAEPYATGFLGARRIVTGRIVTDR